MSSRKYTFKDGQIFISLQEVNSILAELAEKSGPVRSDNGLQRLLALATQDAFEQAAQLFLDIEKGGHNELERLKREGRI